MINIFKTSLITIIGFLLFCTISLTCLFLSVWQFHRAQEKIELIESLDQFATDKVEPYKKAIMTLTTLLDYPLIIIESGLKTWDYYQVVNTLYGPFFLHLGNTVAPIKKIDEISHRQDSRIVRFYPISYNPFVKKSVTRVDGIVYSYSIEHVMHEKDFDLINSKLILLDLDPSPPFSAKVVTVPLSPDRHKAYALQWIVLSLISVFFGYYFLKNEI